MGRPRNARNKGLPENLYTQTRGGTVYYRYRHPETHRYIGLGTDRTAALRAARLANGRLLSTPSAERLVARILNTDQKFDAYADSYRTNVLPARRDTKGDPLAPNTLKEYDRYLQRAIDAWGEREVASITRRDVAEHLEPMTPNVRNHARSTLQGLFNAAIADGLIEINPVVGTVKARVVVQRRRLEHAQYLALRAKAEPWLQNAMDLALHTLQRREDLVKLTADDLVEGALHVRQSKTGVNLRIRIWYELAQLLPRTGPLINRKGKPVKKDYFSRAFAKARDLVPELHVIPNGERPSLHELRALGARLLEEQGIDPQTLLGHLEAKTTRLYLDRHKEKWIEV